MAPVLDRPFLEWQLERLAQAGLQRFVLAVGYLAQQIVDHFGDGSRWGWNVTYAIEPVLLGTAGAIRNAALAKDTQLQPDEPFLVMNGDTYLEIDLGALLDAHLANGHLVTMALAYVDDASRYGTVEVTGSGRIRSFNEKCSKPASGLVNAGVYVLDPSILHSIPGGRAVSLERETFPELLSSGQAIHGVPTRGPFVDIGTPESYQQIETLLVQQRSQQGESRAGDE
jgi:mannose-1-phosphate guanylyltransferase